MRPPRHQEIVNVVTADVVAVPCHMNRIVVVVDNACFGKVVVAQQQQQLGLAGQAGLVEACGEEEEEEEEVVAGPVGLGSKPVPDA